MANIIIIILNKINQLVFMIKMENLKLKFFQKIKQTKNSIKYWNKNKNPQLKTRRSSQKY